MRKPFTILAAVALLLAALPSAASAHRAVRFSDDHTYVECDLLTTTGATASFMADVSREFGGYAGLQVWLDPASPELDPPTWTTGDAQADLSDDGSTLSASMDLYELIIETPGEVTPDATGELGPFVGQATATLTLAPAGDPMPFGEQTKGGTNQKQRVQGTDQMLTVSGEIVLPDATTFDDLSGCFAVREVVSVFYNSPDSYVDRSSSIGLVCQWSDEDRFILLEGYGDPRAGYAFADLFMATPTSFVYGSGDAILTSSAFSTAFDLYTDMPPHGEGVVPEATGGGQEPAGYAEASATLTSTGSRSHYMERQGSVKFKIFSHILSVDGSLLLRLPDGDLSLSMSDAVCAASVDRVQYIESTPASNDHGKPLANDLPENALPIAVGDSVTVRSTAGTAFDAEVPCTMVDPEFGDIIELPIGHTAWWAIGGSGDEITVDTAGSSFDTIVGVYTYDGNTYNQVGCVDDVDTPEGGSFQAAITFGTDAGLMYYVQVGGFGGATGRLQLTVS